MRILKAKNVGFFSYGADSDEVDAEVMAVDELLATFVALLEGAGIRDETDIIIVSDHGNISP